MDDFLLKYPKLVIPKYFSDQIYCQELHVCWSPPLLCLISISAAHHHSQDLNNPPHSDNNATHTGQKYRLLYKNN